MMSVESGTEIGTRFSAPWVAVPVAAGRTALVDPEDAARVLALRWHTWHKPGRPGELYAKHTQRIGRNTRTIWLHRFVLGVEDSAIYVDHVDGVGLNCRKYNLRAASCRQNAQHTVRSKNQRKGGFKGVTWNTRASKWEAAIAAGDLRPDGKRRKLYLGVFNDPADAARAYDAAALRLFGEFAALNFPISSAA